MQVARIISVPATVSAVERRSMVVRGYKDAKGEPVFEREDLGWFIVLKEFGIAIGVGSAEPELKPGQRVKVSIEATS